MGFQMDAAQRQFVVKRIAQYCPEKLVISAFAIRWKVILKDQDIAELNPDFGGLLGPEDDSLFRASRAEVDPNLEGIGSRKVTFIVLNWMFLDYKSRGDYRGMASIIDQIKSLGISEASNHALLTKIEWIAAEPPAPPLKET